MNEYDSFHAKHTWSATAWSAGRTDGVGGGYDKCMYVEPPGEVDTNYKHTQIKLPTFTQYFSENYDNDMIKKRKQTNNPLHKIKKYFLN